MKNPTRLSSCTRCETINSLGDFLYLDLLQLLLLPITLLSLYVYLTCLIGVNNSFEFLEWLRHLLYSFFPLPPFKLFILFHQHYLNRSRPYLIIVQQQLAPLILTNNHRTQIQCYLRNLLPFQTNLYHSL